MVEEKLKAFMNVYAYIFILWDFRIFWRVKAKSKIYLQLCQFILGVA